MDFSGHKRVNINKMLNSSQVIMHIESYYFE